MANKQPPSPRFFIPKSTKSHLNNSTLATLLFSIAVFLIVLFSLCLCSGEELISIKSLCISLSAAMAAFFPAKRLHLFPRRRQVEFFVGNNEPLKTPVSRNAKEGVECYANGNTYHGEFHSGKYNGSGVYSLSESWRYEGDWINGQFDGYGINSYDNGSIYKGKFYKGRRQGYGVYQSDKGEKYSGEWYSDVFNGQGVLSFQGNYYKGEFKHNTKHGPGVCFFRNGDTYSGEYTFGQMSGYGVHLFANGNRYEGSFHDDVANGFGAFTFKNGEVRTGEWEYSALKELLPPNHPKVLQFIQSGRTNSEKAYGLPNMDDCVKKAVDLANTAANEARVAATRATQNHQQGKMKFWHLIRGFFNSLYSWRNECIDAIKAVMQYCIKKVIDFAITAAKDARVAAMRAAHRHHQRKMKFWPLIHGVFSYLTSWRNKDSNAILPLFTE